MVGFPGGSDRKVSAYNAEDRGSIPGSGRSPGEGNGNPLQYSCLENPMDEGAWTLCPWGGKESDTTEQLHFTYGNEYVSMLMFLIIGEKKSHLLLENLPIPLLY